MQLHKCPKEFCPPLYHSFREISDRGIKNDTSRTVKYPLGESQMILHVTWNIRSGNFE